MNRGFWVLFFMFFAGMVNAQSANFANNQLYIKLRDDFSKELPLFSERKTFNSPGPIFDQELTKAIELFNIYKVVENKKTSKINTLKLSRIYTIRVEDTSRIASLIVELSKLPFIEYVERVPIYQVEYTPNDLSPNQWNLTKSKIPQAWDLSRGLSTVVIAIVDDAIRLNHEDLAANIWVNPKEIPNNGRDDDNNGYVDDINGYDVADNDNNPSVPTSATNSEFTHGTHCAGIASASTDNSRGIASPGFSCKIMAVKTKQSSDRGPTLPYAYDGLEYAISSGAANVISLSWGGYGRSNTYQLLIDFAYSKGIIIVAAAGNSNTNIPFYPASYNHVLSVGATDIDDKRAFFSNYGSSIDLMAPGVNIWSTLAGSISSYGYLSGTSMACPLVSGICGLMLSYAPGSSPDFIESCLKSNADNINGLNPGYVGQLGAGRVNAQGALACLRGIPVADFIATTTSVCAGQSVNFNDKSLGNAIYAWNWTFSGANISRSTLRNPSVTYTTPGTYSVSLTVTNNGGSNTVTKQRYITVYQPTASISGSNTISVGQSTPLRFDFSGNIPYTVAFSDGLTTSSLSGINSSPYFAYVSPNVTKTYTISSFSDGSCSGSKNGIAIISVSTVTAPCQNCTSNTGLVGYYPFCGNANDVSGNNNTGTVTGATLNTDRFGNQNSSYLFNGVNQSINIGNKSSLKMANGLSISLWIKPTIIPTSGLYNIISDHAPGEAVDGIGKMMRFAGEELQFHVDGVYAFGTAIYARYNFPNSSANSWHHIVGTYDRNKVKLYVNGNLVDSVNHSNPLAINTNPLLIGRSGYGEYFNGQIDDIRIFNRALTANEVAGYFTEPAPCTSTGLVASFPFCGNANDVSGNNFTGTVSGATLTSDKFGNPNSAYNFNGVNSYIRLKNTDTLNLNRQSFSFWIYNAGNTVSGIINKWSNKGYAWAVDLENNKIWYFINSGGPTNLLQSSQNIPLNTWSHIVVSYDNDSLRLYINGVLTDKKKVVQNIVNSTEFIEIGRRINVNYHFKGSIDNVKIYNKVLTQQEVTNLYNEPAPCTSTGLVASYPFCGNANDVSGNGNNGKIVQNVPGNTGAILSTDRFNQPNSCYYFDGTYVGTSPNQKANYIDIGSAPGLKMNGNQVAISCWINSMGPDYNSGRIVLGGAVNAQYTLVIESGKILWRPILVGQPGGVNTYEIYSNTNISTNTWYHVVAMYDGTKSSVYINGTLDKSVFTNGEPLQTSAGVALIGGEDQSHAGGCCASSFNGKIDDVKIYNKALSITEIQNLYNEPAPCTSTGLVASYPFCGNANDVSGNNYHGTVTGATFTTDRFGNANGAYYFDGSNGCYINTNFNGILGTNPRSISAWVKLGSTKEMYAFGWGSRNLPYGSSYSGGFSYGSSLTIISEGNDVVKGFGTTDLNNWHHIVWVAGSNATFNQTQIYYDGVLLTTSSVNYNTFRQLNTLQDVTFKIGANALVGSNLNFQGSIDDVKVYDKVLSQSEVTALYNEPAPCTTTGLVASYPFCGNANDVSGNNYNGTVTGVVLTNDRFGNANSAYFFNGSVTPAFDNNIKFNAPYGSSKTAFSISIWAKSEVDITSVREYPTMANFYNNTSSLVGENARLSWVAMVLGSAYPSNQLGRVSFVKFPQGGGNVQLNTTTTPAVNVWNHYVFTYNPSSNVMQIYLNGNLNNINSISGISNPNLFNSLIIGREYDGGNNDYSATFFKGAIDDIKIYNRVLNASEVLSLYNEPAPCTSTGLIASYPFCGNANDVSGNNYNGTVTGASLATDRFGNTNSAYFFNGSNYIRTSFPGISGTNARTLNFWVKPTPGQQNSYQYLGSYGLFQNGGFDIRCGINFNQAGQASFDISGGAIAKQTNNLYDGNWHMLTYAIPANTVLTGVKIYLDGTLLTVTSGVCCSGSESTLKINTITTAVTTSSANLFNFNIGVLFTGNYNSPTLYGYYNGYLDDISIYNYQLTQSQIQALFNAPAPCTSDSLVLYYPFCKNPNDLTKFANNGTSSGANLTKDRFGYTESAYNFNGTNSFIESPLSTSLGIGNAGTISLWARRNNWSNLPLVDKEFINNNYAYPNANNLYLSFHYGQGIHFRFKNGEFDFVSSNIHTTWQDNSWHHIVGKWEPNGTNTRISLYADGVLLATNTISGTINVGSAKWNLGKYLTATHQEWFDGDLDDVRIYNKAITATTIATLFNESAQCITCLTTVTPAIVGNTSICNSGVESYSISSIAGISYTWSVTGSNFIRQNGNQATVTWAGQGIFTLSGIPSSTCVGISKLTVTVGCCTLTPVKADFVVNTNSCTGQGFSLTNASINTSLASTYLWNFGPDAVPSQSTVTNPSFVYYKTPGRKVITLKVTGPGCRQTDTKSDTIFFFPVPIANAGPDIYLCTTLGQSLGSSGISDNRYVWHPGTYVSDSTQSQPTLTKFYNGPLVLEVRYGESNCIGYDTVQVYQYPAVSQDKAAICKGDVVTLKAASWNTKGLYTWKPSTYIYQDLGGTVVVNPDKDTTFTLSINSISGCSIATAKILVEQPYVLKVSHSPLKYCINDTLSLKVANPRSNFEYTWFKHADSTVSTKGINAKFVYAKPNIQAKAVENGICNNTVILPVQGLDSTFATIHTPVVESICIEPTLTISSSLPQNKYKWSDGSTTNSTKAVSSGLYWVKTYNFCEEHTDSFYVTIRNVENYFPNVFSPNDDQKNDVLIFQGCAFQLGDVSFEVFNRMGEKVYSNSAYKNDWTAKGIPSGMYFYILKYANNDELAKGWLQIIK